MVENNLITTTMMNHKKAQILAASKATESETEEKILENTLSDFYDSIQKTQQKTGYEKFSVYRSVSTDLGEVLSMNVSGGGIPDAALIQARLKSIQNDLIFNEGKNITSNPEILIGLLKSIAGQGE